MRVPFVGGAYAGISRSTNEQSMIGYYAEYDSKDQRSPKYAIPTPMLQQAFTITQGSPISIQGTHYVTPNLYTVDTAGNLVETNLGTSVQTNRGGLPGWTVSNSPIQIIDNGKSNGHQLLICNNANAWVFDMNTFAITSIASTSNWPSSIRQVTQQDTFSIVIPNDNSCTFYVSSSFQYKTCPALNFAQPQTITDNLVAVISDNVRLYLFGAVGMEVWYNSGDPNFTFTRIPGAVYPIGCASTNSVAKLDNGIIFLGTNEWGEVSVYKASGIQPPQRISTTQIDFQLCNRTFGGAFPIAGMFATTYKDVGHEFYLLNTGDGITWCYDTTNGEWHQRKDSVGTLSGWPCGPHTFIPPLEFNGYAGKHLFGSWTVGGGVYWASGQMLVLTNNYGLGNDHPVRQIVSPHINDQEKRLYVNAFQMNFNYNDATQYVGGGVPTGTMTLSWAKNSLTATNTFANSATFVIGSQPRFMVRRLGWARDWVFKIDTSACQYPPIIMDGFVTLAYRTEGSPQDVT